MRYPQRMQPKTAEELEQSIISDMFFRAKNISKTESQIRLIPWSKKSRDLFVGDYQRNSVRRTEFLGSFGSATRNYPKNRIANRFIQRRSNTRMLCKGLFESQINRSSRIVEYMDDLIYSHLPRVRGNIITLKRTRKFGAFGIELSDDSSITPFILPILMLSPKSSSTLVDEADLVPPGASTPAVTNEIIFASGISQIYQNFKKAKVSHSQGVFDPQSFLTKEIFRIIANSDEFAMMDLARDNRVHFIYTTVYAFDRFERQDAALYLTAIIRNIHVNNINNLSHSLKLLHRDELVTRDLLSRWDSLPRF